MHFLSRFTHYSSSAIPPLTPTLSPEYGGEGVGQNFAERYLSTLGMATRNTSNGAKSTLSFPSFTCVSCSAPVSGLSCCAFTLFPSPSFSTMACHARGGWLITKSTAPPPSLMPHPPP